MKIQDLVNSIPIHITNEERAFITRHQKTVRITALDEHDHWLAQNLVRKGVYSVREDNNTLVKNENHT